jgi:hypothetical protein
LLPGCSKIKKLLYIENFDQVDAIDRFNQVDKTKWRNFAPLVGTYLSITMN